MMIVTREEDLGKQKKKNQRRGQGGRGSEFPKFRRGKPKKKKPPGGMRQVDRAGEGLSCWCYGLALLATACPPSLSCLLHGTQPTQNQKENVLICCATRVMSTQGEM